MHRLEIDETAPDKLDHIQCTIFCHYIRGLVEVSVLLSVSIGGSTNPTAIQSRKRAFVVQTELQGPSVGGSQDNGELLAY